MVHETKILFSYHFVFAWWKFSAFEVGKEYVYEYRGKLQVKNPEQPLQSTGVAFKSKVVTQPRKEHTHFKARNHCILASDFPRLRTNSKRF